MSDPNQMTFGEGEPEFETLKVEYEPIPVDPDEALPEPYRGKSKEDLIAEMETIKAKLNDTSTRADSVVALTQGLDKLGQTLARGQAPAPPPADGQKVYQERYEKLKKRLKDDPLDDMEGALDEYHQLKLEPVVQQLLASNMPVYRKLASIDGDVGEIMKRWGPEVDEIVNRMAPAQKINNPDVYIEAAKRVRADHYKEMLQEEVEKATVKAVQESGGRAPTPLLHAEGGINSRPAKQKSPPKLTDDEREMCRRRGMEEEDYRRWKYGE